MNVVQCLSHSIEEFDMLKMYARIGVNVFSVGGYIQPSSPHDDKRPGVPEMAFFPQLKEAVDRLRQPDNLRAAQENLPAELLEWADVIVYHHMLPRLYGQWPRVKRWLREGSHRRVIWRTVGQSVDGNEAEAKPYVREGLEIVRYSPRERNIPNYAGESALIRFGKDPADWYGWTGSDNVVGNVTQHLLTREPYCNAGFYMAATEGLPARPAGPGSEQLPGGVGSLTYDAMRQYLRDCRVYIYTGTQPASYTLGLIEAQMTGVPIVSIGPNHMRIFPYGPSMFEGHLIAANAEPGWADEPTRANEQGDDPKEVRDRLRVILENDKEAQALSEQGRAYAIRTFGIDTIAAQWAAFLGVSSDVTLTAEPENVQPVLGRIPEVMVRFDALSNTATLAGLRSNDFAAGGGVPDGSPGAELVAGVPGSNFGVGLRSSVSGRRFSILAGRPVSTGRIVAFLRGVVAGNGGLPRGLPFGLGRVLGFARHDDNDTAVAA